MEIENVNKKVDFLLSRAVSIEEQSNQKEDFESNLKIEKKVISESSLKEPCAKEMFKSETSYKSIFMKSLINNQ